MQYSAVRCNCMQCCINSKSRNLSASSLNSLRMLRLSAGPGETRDTGPGFKQTRARLSLRGSGRDLLRASDFRETAPALLSLFRTATASARAENLETYKILSRKKDFESNLNFFPGVINFVNIERDFHVSCVDTV